MRCGPLRRRIDCATLVVLLGSTGCYTTPDTLGEACQVDDDCNDAQVCRAEICERPPAVPATTNSGGATFGACTDDEGETESVLGSDSGGAPACSGFDSEAAPTTGASGG